MTCEQEIYVLIMLNPMQHDSTHYLFVFMVIWSSSWSANSISLVRTRLKHTQRQYIYPLSECMLHKTRASWNANFIASRCWPRPCWWTINQLVLHTRETAHENPRESSSNNHHSISVWLPKAYSNEDNVVMTVVHVKTQIIPVNQS